MTEKLTFPDGFLWGGATAANQCEGGPMMLMVEALPMSMWCRLVRIVSRLLLVRKRCLTLRMAISIRQKSPLICTTILKKILRFLAKWALRLIGSPLLGLGFFQREMS